MRTPLTVDGELVLLLQFAFSVVAVSTLVFLTLGLIRNLSSRRASRVRFGEAPARSQDSSQDGSETAPGPSLEDAERFAAEERWTEAVHTLLLLAIRHLSSRFVVPAASSRTSREMSRLLPLQAEAREAFAGLVRTVELSLFGGLPAGPDDYQTSLERVRLLLRRSV